jgi:hypothetical protein
MVLHCLSLKIKFKPSKQVPHICFVHSKRTFCDGTQATFNEMNSSMSSNLHSDIYLAVNLGGRLSLSESAFCCLRDDGHKIVSLTQPWERLNEICV